MRTRQGGAARMLEGKLLLGHAQQVRMGANTFNLRSTRAGSGYGQGQHDQGERPAGFLALGWIGGLGRIAVAPFGVAGGVPALPGLCRGCPASAAPRPAPPATPPPSGNTPHLPPPPPP